MCLSSAGTHEADFRCYYRWRVAPAVVLRAGDVFHLADGGTIIGEQINRDESPLRQYVIQTTDGAKVTLDASQVGEVVRQRREEAEYERIRPTFADTAEAQCDLAQWCREHHLTATAERTCGE